MRYAYSVSNGDKSVHVLITSRLLQFFALSIKKKSRANKRSLPCLIRKFWFVHNSSPLINEVKCFVQIVGVNVTQVAVIVRFTTTTQRFVIVKSVGVFLSLIEVGNSINSSGLGTIIRLTLWFDAQKIRYLKPPTPFPNQNRKISFISSTTFGFRKFFGCKKK